MEQVGDPQNLLRAYRRVRSNKGKPGVDGMTGHELADWLRENNAALTASLRDGTYQPQPVRGVQVPKPGGGQRQLGIPVVVDRLVQQMILQVLEPILDSTFSNSSYGFRPNRSAHMALEQARKYVTQEGREFVVDLDLEKFFDRVNHDILMSRIARRIRDKRLLGIIRRFLQAGLMQDGVRVAREEGTPPGGPLSPLLANLLPDDLDQLLESRGHRFCRYADDGNIYVRSLAAGQRVMESVTGFFGRDTPAPGEPRKERRRSGRGTQVSRPSAAFEWQTRDLSQERKPREGEDQADRSSGSGCESGAGHRRTQPVSGWMDHPLLPLCGLSV